MESWTGSRRQPPLYSNYGTVPRQSPSHMYQEKQHAQNFQQPVYERDLSHEMNWWTVPGSRTGWVLQDHNNWTGAQMPDFPSTVDSWPHSQGFGKQQGRERAEREWARAEMERAHNERESQRKVQREGWGRRWEPCSPVRYRRDCKRSLSDSSHRELEAWASRYCHSLPRKRRTEAGMWGAQRFQRGQVQERERFPQWVGRDGSAEFQGTCPPPTHNPPMGAWRREEEGQPAIPVRHPQSLFLKRSWEQDRKENELSYQQGVSSQPPSYIPPPPYSAPHYSLLLTQQLQKYAGKDTVSYVEPILTHQQAQEGNYCSLMASLKQEVHGDVRTEQQVEEAWTEEWNNRKQLDLRHRQGHVDNKTRDGSPPPRLSDSTTLSPSQGQPEIATELKEQTLPEAGTSVKAKLKKKRGRETVFCLVSRLGGVAGLSSSPEDPLQSISLPLFGVSSLTDTAGSGADVLRSEGSGEGSGGFQPADEIDSKVPDQRRFSSPSRAPPLWTPLPKMGRSSRPQVVQSWAGTEQEAAHREELCRAIQTGLRYQTRRTSCQSLVNAEDTEGSKTEGPQAQASAAPDMSKRAQQPHGSVKFPLWKEPSPAAQMNTSTNCQCVKGNWKQQGGAAEGLSHDQEDSSSALCDCTTEESMLDGKEDTISDGSSGMIIIDATCVVVRAEFIFPPKKELVQYPSGVQSLNPEPLNNGGIINNHPAEQELDMLPQDNLLQKSGEETERALGKQELQSHEQDSEQTLTPLHNSPSETDVSHSISDIEAQTTSESSNSSSPYPVIPANETLEERALRILGIALLGSSVEDTKSKEPPPDSPVHYTGETRQSSSELPSTEPGPEATRERGQDEDRNYLPDSDTAEDDELLSGENTPGMDIEERRSQVEELKSLHPSAYESSGEDEAICTEGIVIQEAYSSSYVQVNQDASSHSENSYRLPSSSQNLCPTPTYFDSPPHSPPKSPTLMPPLDFPVPLSESPTNDLLQVPCPLSPAASCSSLSRSSSCTCSPSRAHSPLCPMCPSSHSLDSTSLAHFPSPPLSPFVPLSPSNASPPFDLISNPEHQRTETPVETLQPPQSLSPLQREEPQYPKSLWDAVYRIRRHTAPDSENEEEEGGEFWDNPVSASEDGDTKEAPIDLVRKGEMDLSTVDTTPQSQEVLEEDSISNSARRRDQPVEITALEGSRDTAVPDTKLLGEKVGLQEESRGEEELGGQVDNDTVSCSSSDSRASRDTVILGNEEVGADGTGVEIREGVEDGEMRVETEAEQTNQILFSCEHEMCGSSEELPGAEETASEGKAQGVTELCPTHECLGDGDETALGGETDNKHAVETNLKRDEDGELVSAISIEGEMGDSVCLGAFREVKHTVTVEIVEGVEFCGDTNKTKGNEDIGLVAENKDVNDDSRYEKICVEIKTCCVPEGEEASLEEKTSEFTRHTAECHTTQDAMSIRGSVPEPGVVGLSCDLFVIGVAQQGEGITAEMADQQETDIRPPEEEVNHSIQ